MGITLIFRRHVDHKTIYQGNNSQFYISAYDLPSHECLTKITISDMKFLGANLKFNQKVIDYAITVGSLLDKLAYLSCQVHIAVCCVQFWVRSLFCFVFVFQYPAWYLQVLWQLVSKGWSFLMGFRLYSQYPSAKVCMRDVISNKVLPYSYRE